MSLFGKGASPQKITDRDRAYVLALHRQFGESAFSAAQLRGRRLPGDLMERFNVSSGRLGDETAFGTRLPELGFVSFSDGKFQLTDAGVALAKEASSKALGSELIGTYHRFGEIGPVYEVLGLEDDGFVKICLVESGDTARYPISEVRSDPPA